MSDPLRAASRLAALTFGVFAAVATAACSKSEDDAPKTMTIGVPPATPAAPSASSDTRPDDNANANTPSAPYKSFFSDVDSGHGAAPVTITTAAPPPKYVTDPDDAASAAIRSRANGCFPLANLTRGSSRSVTLTFVVLATGRVSRSDVSGASPNTDGAFYSCLRGVADGASFPEKPDAGTDTRTISVIAQATAS